MKFADLIRSSRRFVALLTVLGLSVPLASAADRLRAAQEPGEQSVVRPRSSQDGEPSPTPAAESSKPKPEPKPSVRPKSSSPSPKSGLPSVKPGKSSAGPPAKGVAPPESDGGDQADQAVEGGDMESAEADPPVPQRTKSRTAPGVRRAAPRRAEVESYQIEPVYQEPSGDFWFGEQCVGPKYWAGVDYVLWWRHGMDLPALVTTSPTTTPATDAGVLGLGTTSILYGNETVGGDARPGGRISLGMWRDAEQTRAFGARAFFLGQANARYDATSSDVPVLARPFFEVTPNNVQQNSLVLAYPGQTTGEIHVASHSDVLGGDVYVRNMLYGSEVSRVDTIVGYQFSRIDEELIIQSTATTQPDTLKVFDSFATRNEFHGAELGLQFVFDRPTWRCDIMAKVGLGSMSEQVTITGRQDPTDAGGGLLARSPSNIGTFTRNEFAAVPELGLNWAWKVNSWAELNLGYSFIYWSKIIQPGSAIDPQLAVNLSDPFTGTLRPAFNFSDGPYWVHGVNLGLTCKF